MSMQAIRDRYGVPAKRGAQVEFEGRPATIASASGHHLRLFFRDAPGDGSSGPYHPLWRMDYLDGVDHGARYDARIEAFNAALNRPSRSPKGEAASS